MPSDSEILAVFRKDKPNYPALAAIIGARWLAEHGEPFTMTALSRVTGCQKSTLYAAKPWLDKWFPDWPQGDPDPTVPLALVETHRAQRAIERARPRPPKPKPAPAPVEIIPAPAQLFVPESVAVALPAMNGAKPPALWRQALAEAMIRHAGARSWDLYEDAYSVAANRVLAEIADGEQGIGELIALSVDYLETVTGDAIDGEDRKLIALLVRSHGKAALHALKESIGIADATCVRDYWRYARRICERNVARIRERQEAEA